MGRNYNQDYFKVQGHSVEDRDVTGSSKAHLAGMRAQLRRGAPLPSRMRRREEEEPITERAEPQRPPQKAARQEQRLLPEEGSGDRFRKPRRGRDEQRAAPDARRAVEVATEQSAGWVAQQRDRLMQRAESWRDRGIRAARFGVGAVLTPVVLARLVWRLRRA